MFQTAILSLKSLYILNVDYRIYLQKAHVLNIDVREKRIV